MKKTSRLKPSKVYKLEMYCGHLVNRNGKFARCNSWGTIAYFADKKLAEYVAGVIYSDVCMTCVEDKPVKVMEINDESIERLIDKYGAKK